LETLIPKKMSGKNENVATDGRTILFVSHDMSALSQLTTRAVSLLQGTIDFLGTPSDAIERYLSVNRERRSSEYDVRNARRRYQGTGDIRILSLRFEQPTPYFGFLEPIRYLVRAEAQHAVDRLRIGMTVVAGDGTPVGTSFSHDTAGLVAGERRELIVELPSARLAPGSYFCTVSVGYGNHRTSIVDYDIAIDTQHFEVEPERTPSGSLGAWHWAQQWGSISLPDLVIESRTDRR
jgi:lipopolysaccharide transport system ATP-binding protein